MITDTVKISGLILQDELKKYNIQYPYKELCKSYIISIPQNSADINSILEVSLNSQILNYKYILTNDKNKIYIDGILNVKIVFIGSSQPKNIYTSSFTKPICEVIPIDYSQINNLKPNIFIEEASINSLNKNKFLFSMLVMICTTSDIKKNTSKTVQHSNHIDASMQEELEILNQNPIKINVEYDMKNQ